MSSNGTRALPIWFVLGLVVALAWHGWGLKDLFATARFGYGLNAEFVVQQVVPASPADQGGLRAGDRLLSIDGWAPDDPALTNRRLVIGKPVAFRVERDGQPVDLRLVPGPLALPAKITAVINAAIGLAFLVAGFFVARRREGPAAYLFSLLALAGAFLFAWTPFLGTRLFGQAVGWALNVLVLVASGLFLHLVLHLSTSRSRAGRKGLLGAIYGPAVLDVGLAIGALAVGGGIFATTAGYLNQWLPRVFLVAALAIVVAWFVRSSSSERRSNAAGVLLVGVLAAVVPFVVLGIVAPRMGLPPGVASLSLLALPPVLALAVLRSTESQATRPGRAT